MRVPILGALALVISLCVGSFGLGSYYGAVYMAVNDKLNWCYGWAHGHQWELNQGNYMAALEWCDTWHAARTWAGE